MVFSMHVFAVERSVIIQILWYVLQCIALYPYIYWRHSYVRNNLLKNVTQYIESRFDLSRYFLEQIVYYYIGLTS